MENKFTQEFHNSIEAIKSKVLLNDQQYSKQEMLHLEFANSEINRVFFNRKRPIKKGCGSCLVSAVTTVKNYINQYHIETTSKVVNNKITRVEITEVKATEPTYQELLRQALDLGFDGASRKKKYLIQFINENK